MGPDRAHRTLNTVLLVMIFSVVVTKLTEAVPLTELAVYSGIMLIIGIGAKLLAENVTTIRST